MRFIITGTLDIKATYGKSTSFTTSTDTVYTTAATTYLNAGTGGSINFNANVSADDIARVIEINDSTRDTLLLSRCN